ncbi:hypothetical protein VTN00DRAFT_3667 [Thermoascus crustaceus]|uniref:uncharacterized protein n=1 Tax=Thermoascus crustaceus TaxID=5088 RepID=UPI00374428E8
MSEQELQAQNLFDVSGFVAVVTGGGSGIGLMATQTLAANGARVYIIGRRQEVLNRVAERYSSKGQIFPIQGDISDTASIRAIAADLEKREEKGINILVNNSGVSPELKAKEESTQIDFTDPHAVGQWMVRDGVEAWRESYAGNVAAHHFLTAALLPLLRKGGQAIPGHSSAIINISSAAGITKTHSQGQFAYSSSKAAFLHLTKEWAHTFVPLRIRANCIAPGLFPTEMTTGVSDENQKSRLEGAGFHFPAGRVGKETDIGSALLYLASRAGTYVNGQVVHVDGGLLLKSPSTE